VGSVLVDVKAITLCPSNLLQTLKVAHSAHVMGHDFCGHLAFNPTSYPYSTLNNMQTFEEREALNAAIVRTINEASEAWGLECMR
jgi:hypothetical protein